MARISSVENGRPPSDPMIMPQRDPELGGANARHQDVVHVEVSLGSGACCKALGDMPWHQGCQSGYKGGQLGLWEERGWDSVLVSGIPDWVGVQEVAQQETVSVVQIYS